VVAKVFHAECAPRNARHKKFATPNEITAADEMNGDAETDISLGLPKNPPSSLYPDDQRLA
jgi:hypothetical protein